MQNVHKNLNMYMKNMKVTMINIFEILIIKLQMSFERGNTMNIKKTVFIDERKAGYVHYNEFYIYTRKITRQK